MAAIHSRMIDINFRFPKEQQPKLAGQLYKRLVYILKAENVPFEDEALVKLVKKFMPTQDLRKIVNRLQDAATKSDHVDMKTLFAYELAIKQLVDFMKEKNFTNVRKWISDNELAVNDEFFRTLYDEAVTYFVPASVPQVILILAKYQYQQAFVVDIDINMAAMCVEIMIEAQFK
jgi:DNA polymerase III delta prime subunit